MNPAPLTIVDAHPGVFCPSCGGEGAVLSDNTCRCINKRCVAYLKQIAGCAP